MKGWTYEGRGMDTPGSPYSHTYYHERRGIRLLVTEMSVKNVGRYDAERSRAWAVYADNDDGNILLTAEADSYKEAMRIAKIFMRRNP